MMKTTGLSKIIKPVDGWYYLHANGDLIFKRSEPEDEPPFVLVKWPVDKSERGCCWTILVEALALGAASNRIMELAKKWGCTNDDALECVKLLREVRISIDGDQWCATFADFIDLQQSPAGFGDTALEAMADLAKEGLRQTCQFVGGKSDDRH